MASRTKSMISLLLPGRAMVSSQHSRRGVAAGDMNAGMRPSDRLASVFAATILAAASDALALQFALLPFVNGVAIG
jgi:hypothetical protein